MQQLGLVCGNKTDSLISAGSAASCQKTNCCFQGNPSTELYRSEIVVIVIVIVIAAPRTLNVEVRSSEFEVQSSKFEVRSSKLNAPRPFPAGRGRSSSKLGRCELRTRRLGNLRYNRTLNSER